MHERMHIDGAQGEGGGQILRTSMALAAICKQPITIEQIRANRSKPGLRPQHLTGVQAMGSLCGGELTGDTQGSDRLYFAPTHLPAGVHTIDIRTAGSTSLLLHALYFGMAMDEGGELTLCGGTHAEKAPTFDYIEKVWAPMMRLCGFCVTPELRAHGMYPKGGGRINAQIPGRDIHPALQGPHSFDWTTRPPLDKIEIKALWAAPRQQPGKQQGRQRGRQPRADIAARMGNAAAQYLCAENPDLTPLVQVEEANVNSLSNGAICSIFLHFGPLRAGFTAWGRRGLPAEDVGARVATDALAFLDSDACLEEHAADQVLLPLALAGHEARFTTDVLSGHLETNAAIIQQFLPALEIKFTTQNERNVLVELSSR